MAIFAVLSVLAVTYVSAQVVTSITRIADTTTPIPNGVGNFTFFDRDENAIFNGEVVFNGQGSNNQRGLYSTFGGGLTRVVDATTPTPGGSGTLEPLEDPALGGSVTTFGSGDSGGGEGIYSFTIAGGNPTVIANLNSAVPGGTGNFTDLFNQSYSNGVTLFKGEDNNGPRGMYTNTGGVLALVANENTPVPDGTSDTFDSFFEPAIRNGNLSFKGTGSGGQEGIYADFGSGLTVVADTNTAAPGGGGNFTGFDESSITGQDVVFQGTVPAGKPGVYRSQAGALSLIADANTAIPDGTGNFTFAGNPAMDGGVIVFIGTGNGGQRGIYLSEAGPLVKLIAVGDALDGRTVSDVDINPHEAIRGNSIVFSAVFSNGSSGIYVADLLVAAAEIPVLNGLGLGVLMVLLAVAAILVAQRRFAL